uniref:Uncharacterized protein n=1 Tax=Leersia perrieri TaxID=77586 RepID=A0A0D9XGH0_9ORYZ
MEIQMSKAGAMEAAGETATFIRCVRQWIHSVHLLQIWVSTSLSLREGSEF